MMYIQRAMLRVAVGLADGRRVPQEVPVGLVGVFPGAGDWIRTALLGLVAQWTVTGLTAGRAPTVTGFEIGLTVTSTNIASSAGAESGGASQDSPGFRGVLGRGVGLF